MYSDAGGTKTFEIDGAGGSVVQMTAFQDGLQIGETSNCGLTLAAGVLSLTDEQGGALAAANPCCVGVPDITAGLNETVCFTAAQTMNDDAHASSVLTDLGFGLTETVAWASDRPSFIGVINEDDTGANAGVFITLDPTMTMTPAAGFIHDSAAAAAGDTQASIYWCGADDAGKAAKPTVIIGALRMQWSTATDDWTIQTLGAAQDTTSATDLDGIGQSYVDKTCAQIWTFPGGQNGALTTAGGTNNYATHLYVAGGDLADDVPTWATSASIRYFYTIGIDGWVHIVHDTVGGGNCTNGDVAAVFAVVMPYASSSFYTGNANGVNGGGMTINANIASPAYIQLSATTTNGYLGYNGSLDLLNANTFSNAAD